MMKHPLEFFSTDYKEPIQKKLTTFDRQRFHHEQVKRRITYKKSPPPQMTVSQLVVDDGADDDYQPPQIIAVSKTPSYRLSKRKNKANISTYSLNLIA